MSIPSCDPDHYLLTVRDFVIPVVQLITKQRVEELGNLGVYITRTTCVLAKYFLDYYGTIMTASRVRSLTYLCAEETDESLSSLNLQPKHPHQASKD